MPPNHEEEKLEQLRRTMYSRKYSDQMGPRERRAFESEQSAVPEDWEHAEREREQGRVLTPLEAIMRPPKPSRVRGILKWTLAAAAVFFVCAIAFFIYYLYFGGASAISTRNIDIAITGPAEIPGGELTNLEINITNHNREALELADLVVSYPPGTRLNSDSCTSQSCRISIGTIEAGASTVVQVPAIYEGGVGQHASVGAELEYRLGGSDAIFVASSQYDFVFSSSPLSVAVSGNTQATSGQPLQMTVTVSSNSSQSIPDVLLYGNTPFGFQLTSATPAQTSTGMWDLGPLNPGDVKTIQINGVLSGQVGDNRVFTFTAGTSANATSSVIDAPLGDTTLAVSIAQPFLNLGISVNGATSPSPIAVAPGDIVDVGVTYKNNLSSEISDAVIVARLSGFPIDGTTIQSDNGFYRSTDNAVLWDKTTTGGAFTTLAAGASGTVNFTFQVASSSALQGIQNPQLDISVSAAGARMGESGVPENLQSTADAKIVVASDLTLKAQGYYFADPFGASGPLPPKAGVETTYAITFGVTNTTNQIQNGVVTAVLPPYVRLVGNYYLPASEKVNFASNTGVFTWNVGDVAPGTGLNGTSPRQVTIQVGFTPSTSQIGTEPTLLQNIVFNGTDASTGKSVQKNVADVTTNIIDDPGFESINAKVVAPN